MDAHLRIRCGSCCVLFRSLKLAPNADTYRDTVFIHNATLFLSLSLSLSLSLVHAYTNTKPKAANYTHLGGGDTGAARVAAIQKALLHGPADATFNVYADFDTAAGHGAVYVGHHGGYKGLHSVKIVGWGVQNNTVGNLNMKR